jgi:hypothetical protein
MVINNKIGFYFQFRQTQGIIQVLRFGTNVRKNETNRNQEKNGKFVQEANI